MGHKAMHGDEKQIREAFKDLRRQGPRVGSLLRRRSDRPVQSLAEHDRHVEWAPGAHSILDTNVASETTRPRPWQSVLDWIEARNPADLFLAAQTIGEFVRGAPKVREQERRERFVRWIEQDLARQFDGRVLSFDGHTTEIWGRLMGDGDRVGRPSRSRCPDRSGRHSASADPRDSKCEGFRPLRYRVAQSVVC